MANKIFRGSHGWYVAWERPDGSHRQPEHYIGMTREEAIAELATIDSASP